MFVCSCVRVFICTSVLVCVCLCVMIFGVLCVRVCVFAYVCVLNEKSNPLEGSGRALGNRERYGRILRMRSTSDPEDNNSKSAAVGGRLEWK